MFENILGQATIVERLSSDVKNNRLPSSLLFDGENYSGKMTAALELARVLSCNNKAAPWNCTCRSCEEHRRLIHPYLVLTGTRYFYEEIQASASILKRDRSRGCRYMYIRNVRKLIKRFDPLLWEGEENKVKKASPLIDKISTKLNLILPDTLTATANLSTEPLAPKEEKSFVKAIDEIAELSKKLAGMVPASLPINQIRKIAIWSRRTSGDKRKVVIIENVEQLLESSSNSLLKILEEPPQGLSLILITSQKKQVMQTILSRVRPYYFYPRGKKEINEITKRVFKEEEKTFASLRQYFISFGDYDYAKIKIRVKDFLYSVQNKDQSFPYTEAKMEKGLFYLLLEELYNELRDWLYNEVDKGHISHSFETVDEYRKLIHQARESVSVYNQSPLLIWEELYFRMRDPA